LNFSYHEAFHTNFYFSRWNSGYQGAFHTNFFFHDGILAIKEPFTRTFLFHDGTLAIKEPFTRTILFHDGILAIREPFIRTFLFHDGILAIKEPFTRTSLSRDGVHKMHDLGEDSFHIYITKSIYIGSTSLKTLPLDLEPPSQGKEYDPSYCNEIVEKKANVFVPEITYKFVTQILFSRL
jgi:hypothetical protein